MATTTNADRQALATAIGGILTVDVEQSTPNETVSFTTDEMADRISESVGDVAEVLERMAENDDMPLEHDDDTWIIEL